MPKQSEKKSKELTAEEFGNNMKSLISKKTAATGKNVTIAEFIGTLDKIDSQEQSN